MFPASHLRFVRLVRWSVVVGVVGQFLPGSFHVRANPAGEQVMAGAALFDRAGSTLTVTQGTDRAVIHWQDFSIAHGEMTQFLQPSATSAVLNRVVSDQLSSIHGTLQANGQVYLVNPNGVFVGASGVIDTAGFVASTHDVANGEFMAAQDLRFQGNSRAAVVNLGKIGADGGDVILIARTVENRGEIRASRGVAALAAGSEVLVKASGQERIFVQPHVDTSGNEAGQVLNQGTIDAASAELKAAGGNEYALAIKNTGVVRATAVENRGGKIWLTASKGTVSNSGTLSARGGATAKVAVRGERVVMKDSAAEPVRVISEGTVLLEGRDGVELEALAHSESWVLARGDLVLRSDAPVLGDAHFKSGDFRVEKMDGAPGDLISPNDPVILSTGNVTLGTYTGASLHILAGGSITTAGITITGADAVGNSIGPGNTVTYNGTNTLAELASVTLSDGTVVSVDGSARATLDLRAGIDWSLLGGLLADFTAGTPPSYTPTAASGSTISTGGITIGVPGGAVLLTNQYRANTALAAGNISTGTINTSVASGGAGDVWVDGRAAVSLSRVEARNLTDGGNGGSVIVLAAQAIGITNGMDTRSNHASGGVGGSGGGIRLESASGNVTVGLSIDTRSSGAAGAGDGGDVTVRGAAVALPTILLNPNAPTSGAVGRGGDLLVEASGNLTTGSINTSSSGSGGTSGRGGQVTLTAHGATLLVNGGISTLSQNSNAVGSGGQILIDSAGTLQITGGVDTRAVASAGTAGNGGNITLRSVGVFTFGSSLNANSFSAAGPGGNGGNILIEVGGGPVSILGINTWTDTVDDQNGNAGNVTIRVGNSGATDGGDNLSIFSITADSTLNTGTGGNGGSIWLEALDGSVTIGGGILTNAFGSLGAGAGGSVRIEASDSVTVGSIINTSSAILGSSGSAGNGGAVTIRAYGGDLTLFGAVVTGSTTSQAGSYTLGNAGDLTLEAGGHVITINTLFTRMGSNTGATFGNAGAIRITGGSMSLGALDASITSPTTGSGGNGGEITLVATTGNIQVNGTVTAAVNDSGSTGSGGTFTATAAGVAGILNGVNVGVNTSGTGGNITLTGASVEMAGFFGTNLATIDVNGPTRLVGNVILSSTGGTIDFNSTVNSQTGSRPTLTATTGSTSVGSITFSGAIGSLNPLGSVLMTSRTIQTAGINTSNNAASGSGGFIDIQGGSGGITTLALNSSSEFTGTGNSGDGGFIRLRTGSTGGAISTGTIRSVSSASDGSAGNAGAVTLSGTGAITAGAVSAFSTSLANGFSGNGGRVEILASGLTGVFTPLGTFDVNTTSVGVLGSGNGGDVVIVTRSGLALRDIVTGSTASAGLSGNGGSVAITLNSSATVGADDFSARWIDARSSGFSGSGNGGGVSVNVPNGSVTLTGLSGLSILTSSLTTETGAIAGASGSVVVNALESISLTGSLRQASGASNSGGAGGAGALTLVSSTGNVSVTDLNRLVTTANGSTGGSGAVLLQALAGSVTVSSNILGTISITNPGNTAGTTGSIGSIRLLSRDGVSVGSIQVRNVTNQTTGSGGSGGAVTLSATQGSVTAGAISTDTSGQGNVGDGGSVTVTGRDGITLGGNINASAFSNGGTAGLGGSVSLTSTQGSLLFTNPGARSIFTNSRSISGSAGGGSITIQAQGPLVLGELASHARVQGTGNDGIAGNGGNITITLANAGAMDGADGLQVTGFISADSGGSPFGATGSRGNGGTVTLSVADGGITVQSINTLVEAGGAGNSAGNGGGIVLTAGNGSVTLGATLNSSSLAQNLAELSGNGGGVSITASGAILSATNTFINTSSSAVGTSGSGGAVTLLASGGAVDLGVSGAISSRSANNGSGGNAGAGGPVSVTALLGPIRMSGITTESVLGNTDNLTGLVGGGGAVTLSASGNVSTGLINTRANSARSGASQTVGGGTIRITSSGGDVTISSFVNTTAQTSVGSGIVGNVQGNSGDVEILAANGVVSAASFIDTSAYSFNGTAGNGGALTVEARSIGVVGGINARALADGGSAVAAGNGGAVTLTATVGDILLTSPNSLLTESVVSSGAAGVASQGGAVTLNATGSVALGGGITTRAFGVAGAGNGGTVTLEGASITVGTINAQASGGSGLVGNGGAIAFTATSGAIQTASLVASASAGSGQAQNAGSITLLASGNITLSGSISVLASGSQGAGAGGDVFLDAGGNLTIGGSIAANTSSAAGRAGKGGSITLLADGTLGFAGLMNTYSQTFVGDGSNGGDILIDVAGPIIFTNGISTWTDAGNGAVLGDAGNITIISRNTGVLDGGDSVLINQSIVADSTVNGGQTGEGGRGGNLTITTEDGSIELRGLVNLNSSGTTGARGSGRLELFAENGDIRIGSFAGRTLDTGTGNTGNSGGASLTATGTVTFNSSQFDVSNIAGLGQGGDGGQIVVEGSSILNTVGTSWTLNSVAVAGAGLGSGNGGVIILRATSGNVEMDNVNLSTRTLAGGGSAGSGGAVEITASGSAAVLDVNTLSVINSTGAGTAGHGGAVTISADGNVIARAITAGVEVLTAGVSGGDGGSVTMDSANGNITVSQVITRSVASGAGGKTVGNGGAIQLTAANGSVTAGMLNSQSEVLGSGTAGNGGTITVTAGSIDIVGSGFATTLYSGALVSSGGSTGDGGDITLRATTGNLRLRNLSAGLPMNTSSRATGTGQAGSGGSVLLEALNGTFVYENANTAINLSSSGQTGAGSGGSFTLRARSLDRTGAATLGVNTSTVTATGGMGNGGAVLVDIETGPVSLDVINSSSVFNGTLGSAGDGGNVTLRARAGALVFGGFNTRSAVTAGGSISPGGGNGGNVLIEASGLISRLSSASIATGSVLAFSNGTAGNGGSITLRSTAGAIDLGGSAFSFSSVSQSAGGVAGNGGDISLTAATSITFSSFADLNSFSDGGTSGGQGGGITFIAPLLNHSVGTLNVNASGELPIGGSSGNIVMDAVVASLSGTITLNAGRDGLVDWRDGGAVAGTLNLFGGDVSIGGATTAGVLEVRAFGDGGATGDITIDQTLGYAAPGGTGAYRFLAAGDVRFNRSLQLDGTGSLTVVAGWDALTTGAINTALTSTQWGNHGGSVFVNSPSSAEAVAVGSRGGTTTFLGHDVRVQSSAADAAFEARIGSTIGAGSGSIVVRAKNDIEVAGNAVGSTGRIGHTVHPSRTGGIELIAGDSVLLADANAGLEAGGDIVVVVDGANPTRPAFSATATFTNNGAITSDFGTVTLFTVSPTQTTLGTINQTVGIFGKRYNKWFGEAGSLVNGVNYKYQPTLTITANNQTKSYGQTFVFDGTEFTVSGLETGDAFIDAISGSVTLSSAGAVATAGVAGSPYAITASATASNLGYALAFVDGTLTVNAAALLITANNQSKTYGQTFSFAGTEFTSTGLQNGETIGSVTLASAGTAATANVAGSPYVITITDPVGGTFDAANYTITLVNGALTVDAAPLEITANNQGKTYGQTFIFAGTEFTSTGLQNGESIGSVTLTSAGAVATAGVAGSPYAIVASNPVGGSFDASNYVITFVNGELTVNAAALEITANNQTKTYGQVFIFTGTEFTSIGLQNGETIGSVTLTSAGAAGTAGVAGSPYVIEASAPVGGTFDIGNYTVSFVDGTLTVNPALITVAANSGSSTYGTAGVNPGLSAVGLQNGEDASFLTGLSNSFDLGLWSNAGTYVLNVVGALTNPNYSVHGTNNGTWVINPVVTLVTVTANHAVRGLGEANPIFSASVVGLPGDINPILTGVSFTTVADVRSVPGNYPITPFGGVLSTNYLGSTVEYLVGLLTVTDSGFSRGLIDYSFFIAFDSDDKGAPQVPEGNGPAEIPEGGSYDPGIPVFAAGSGWRR